MAKPPASPPSSDIEGVNRDARIGKPAAASEPNAAVQIRHAQDNDVARPAETLDEEDRQAADKRG